MGIIECRELINPRAALLVYLFKLNAGNLSLKNNSASFNYY